MIINLSQITADYSRHIGADSAVYLRADYDELLLIELFTKPRYHVPQITDDLSSACLSSLVQPKSWKHHRKWELKITTKRRGSETRENEKLS